MLRAFAKQLLGQITQTSLPANSPPLGTIDAISQLTTPVYGEVEGVGPVTITGDANMVGFSPVRFCVDNEHEGAWIPVDKILFTDPRLQPIATGGVGGRLRTER